MPTSASPSYTHVAARTVELYVSMAQTRYRRPFNIWLFFAIALGLLAIFFALYFTIGSNVATWLFLTLFLVVAIAGGLLDPGTSHAYTERLEDGTEIKVKRPLIGLKRFETKFGLTGDYEVSADGWRYEMAYVVI